jgi:hypothetical protein
MRRAGVQAVRIYIHGCEGTRPEEATPDARTVDITGVDEGGPVRIGDMPIRWREASQGNTVHGRRLHPRTSSRSTARAGRTGA